GRYKRRTRCNDFPRGRRNARLKKLTVVFSFRLRKGNESSHIQGKKIARVILDQTRDYIEAAILVLVVLFEQKAHNGMYLFIRRYLDRLQVQVLYNSITSKAARSADRSAPSRCPPYSDEVSVPAKIIFFSHVLVLVGRP